MGVIILVLSGILFLLDTSLKGRVESTPDFKEEVPFENKPIIVRKVHNEGFAMGILKDQPEKVTIITFIATCILAVYTLIQWVQKGRYGAKLGSALVLSGALSNLYDRLVRGYVVDYIGFETKVEKLKKITFNIGDFCIFIGTLFLLLPRKGNRKGD